MEFHVNRMVFTYNIKYGTQGIDDTWSTNLFLKLVEGAGVEGQN